MRFRLSLAATLAAMLSLCGVASAGTNPTVHLNAAAQNRARAIVVTPRDFPAGWLADPKWQQGSPLDLVGPVCPGVTPDLSRTTVAGFWSSGHQRSSGRNVMVVEHGVLLFATPAQATTMVDEFVIPWASRCMSPGRKDASTSVVSAKPFQPAVVKAETYAYHFVLAVKGAPFTRFYTDAVFLRTGSAFSMFLFQSTSRPFDPALERRLVFAVSARMAAGA